jgi:F-type H+-transporting ATPase subunit a
MHHEFSIFYAWLNALAVSLFGEAPKDLVVFSVKGFALKFPAVPFKVDGIEKNGWIPDHVLNASLVVLLLLVLGLFLRSRLSKKSPGGFQQVIEIVVGGLRGLLADVIGHGSDHYLWMIGSFAFFIFFCNAFGLIFFLQPPTANLNTNLALALVSFTFYHVQGFRHSGFGYLKHFLGPILLLAPLFLILEPISHVARILSLTLRLTGNITGEHTATGVFAGIFPLIVPLPMMFLGIIGTFMQTFIFVMLSSVYVAGAVSDEH